MFCLPPLLQLYLILGQACVHKAMYAGGSGQGSALCSFLHSLATDLLAMENRSHSLSFRVLPRVGLCFIFCCAVMCCEVMCSAMCWIIFVLLAMLHSNNL